ncbi:hypothetical protein FRC02_002387 [Tulasnella sp. 418]|nr:hypothetical protein FRC02_002387 [Tulasnella sp. 418]
MTQIMKPGALLVLGNGLLQFYDEYGKPYRDVNEGEEGFSWLQKWFMEVQNAYFRNNTTSFRAVDEYLNPHKYWHQWLESNPNFANVISWDMIVRLGNWSSETRDDIRIANDYCQSTVINLIKSFVPLLLTSGQPPELVEHWRMEATKELQELRLHSYGKWRWTWCIRTDCEWIPRYVDT